MAGNEHLRKAGFWDVPEKTKAKIISMTPAPQTEKAPQNERRIADWLRKGLVSSITPREEAIKERENAQG